VNFIPYWESFHTYTHCISWVIYLKFLSIGKFVLIENLTLNYIFAYFWNAIWLLYQLFIHVCSEAIFRKKIFFYKFFSSFRYSVWRSGRSSSWVRTRAAQSSGQLSDLSGHARFCRVLIWQWPSGGVSCTFRRVPYKF